MTLHILHLPVDPRSLMAAGRDHGLVQTAWAADSGYLVHALLSRLLADLAPKPFDLQDTLTAKPSASEDAVRPLSLLAYSTHDVRALADAAEARVDPVTDRAIAWGRAASKPMPDFVAGQELGFRVRLCPMIRIGKQHPAGFAHGAEVDPYHARLLRELAVRGIDFTNVLGRAEVAAELPSREQVYGDWLADRFGMAARPVHTRLTSLRDIRPWRRGAPKSVAARTMHGHDRRRGRGAVLGRREAILEGHLRVEEPGAFRDLLSRGVGRHRAFGFGMLLLRPVTEG